MQQTKISNSTGLPCLEKSKPAILLKIYPVEGISQPIELHETGYVFGRDANCSVALDDDAVSRRHASIERNGSDFVLRDLGSTNGCFVNEQRVQSCILKAGDRIRFGKQIFKFLPGEEIESLYHEMMFNLMISDGLTQVMNKRFFMELYGREWESMYRRKDRLSLLVMDLDKFKSVNDTYGHLAGDAILVEFAKRASSVLRSSEIFARFGGEEFVALCCGASLDEACCVAERIREKVSEAPFRFEDIEIPVTVSIGAASTSHLSTITKQGLIERADQCLYRAKNLGRNQVQSIPENVS